MSINPLPQELIAQGLGIHDVAYDCDREKWVVIKDVPKMRIPLVGVARVHESAEDVFESVAKELSKLKGPDE